MQGMGIGPRNPFSQELHAKKYRQQGESFDDYCIRYARTTADDASHFRHLLDGLRSQAILPAGRQQRAVGWPFQTTAFNCFTADIINDDTRSIGEALTEAMLTLRSGGGCGWDFSTLRPHGDAIRGLGEDAYASGPVSFMGMWDAMCKTIRSAGERRGAMMGVLRVDHPDIMRFIAAKKDQKTLTNFNISVGVTNKFMEAIDADGPFDLLFKGRVYQTVRARDLWAMLMESNWDWAEPGVLFLDVINGMNPLRYCETIYATNPCSEQPLPPNGACLLLSLNMVKFLTPNYRSTRKKWEIDVEKFAFYTAISTRACDNVFEHTVYPLEGQRQEAFNKRRMGIGVTGMANALEVCGYGYASPDYLEKQSELLEVMRNTCYETSIDMSRKKGSFPLFHADRWLDSGFAKTLPDYLREQIGRHGLRNGLLLSIAPTGTISLIADNVSSGIEPPPFLETDRIVQMADGPRTVPLNDYAYEEYGVRGKTAMTISAKEHVKVLTEAQKYIDSSISKTVNVNGVKSTPTGEIGSVTFDEFKELYTEAYKGGAKGCSTFNVNGKRAGILSERVTTATPQDVAEPSSTNSPLHTNGEEDHGKEDSACHYDSVSGMKTCG